jgi:hypothetical protein
MTEPLHLELHCSDLEMGTALARRAGARFFGYDEEAIGVELVRASEDLVLISGEVLSFRCSFIVTAYGEQP